MLMTGLLDIAVGEHSKHDLKYWIKSLWVLVGVGGAVCGWQVSVDGPRSVSKIHAIDE